MKTWLPLVLCLSLLSGCTVTIGGKREVVAIESTPLQEHASTRVGALPPAAIPLIEAIFKGLFSFLNKSREQIEDTHRKALEYDRPMKRESEFNLIKVEK